jgi:site-specific recombinase XerC
MNGHELEETVRRIVCALHGEGLASAAAIAQILAAAKEYTGWALAQAGAQK